VISIWWRWIYHFHFSIYFCCLSEVWHSDLYKFGRSCGAGFSCRWYVSIQHHIKALQHTPPKYHDIICGWRCVKTWLFTICFGYRWSLTLMCLRNMPHYRIPNLTFCPDTHKEIYLARLEKGRGFLRFLLLYSWQLQLVSLKPWLWFWGLEYSSTLWVSHMYVKISYLCINASMLQKWAFRRRNN